MLKSDGCASECFLNIFAQKDMFKWKIPMDTRCFLKTICMKMCCFYFHFRFWHIRNANFWFRRVSVSHSNISGRERNCAQAYTYTLPGSLNISYIDIRGSTCGTMVGFINFFRPLSWYYTKKHRRWSLAFPAIELVNRKMTNNESPKWTGWHKPYKNLFKK